MVDIEVFLVVIIDVDVEVGNLVLGFGGDDHVVCGLDLKFSTFCFVVVLQRIIFRLNEAGELSERTYFFESNVWVFVICAVVGKASDIAKWSRGWGR